MNSQPTYLFTLGFRSFFLVAGLYACWSLLTWILVFCGVHMPVHAWEDNAVWHAHEMIYGYTAAVIAGFLLTAVPNWTKARPVHAWPLMLLTGLWLLGRVVMYDGFGLAWWAVAFIDTLFLPAIGLSLFPAVVRGSSTRNYVFFMILGLLGLLNVMVHTDMHGHAGWLDARQALHASVFLIILMIVIFGGRVVPMFTRNALKAAGTEVTVLTSPLLEAAAVGGVGVLAALALMGQAGSQFAGWVSLISGLLHSIRMAGWHGHRTLRMPIVWVLHAGYGWIALGLLFHGIAVLQFPHLQLLAFHVLTIGGIGTMTLAMMSRVSLGHTGHRLQAAKAVVAAYIILQLAVLMRLAGGLDMLDYTQSIVLSGSLWSLAFGLFSVVYLPILLRPRADGREG